MKNRFGIITLLLFLLIGCMGNPQKPDHLIPEKKYIDLLVELQLVRSFADNATTDSTTVDSLTKAVYKKYGVTAQQFHNSHEYYQQFPEKQKERVDKAIEELKMDQVEDTTQTTTKKLKTH